jgi:pfkB family carbohydrate kinase
VAEVTVRTDSEIDYLAVGHVTVDVICDDERGRLRQPGGSAFYGALQAARLGLRAMIITAGVPDELEELLAPYRDRLELHVSPAAETTTFATQGSGAARRQRILSWAGPIPRAASAPATRILHLAPVARELSGDCGLAAPFIGITPQGLVRRWERLGAEVRSTPLTASDLPARFDAAVISETERASCEALLRAQVDLPAPVVAITAGPRPTAVRVDASTTELVPPPTIGLARDDLGAGDVFAAAFFVALARGRHPTSAAAFGNAAAAVRIEGIGPSAVGDAAAIESALARGHERTGG